MKDILVINIQNFPSGMIHVFQQMECMSKFCKDGCFLRCYSTNANKNSAFYDLIMDAPLNSMCDDTWHTWSHQHIANHTIFHSFRQKGYDTYFCGVFGLDSDLDPHKRLFKEKSASTIMEMYGISHFLATKDDAFSCEFDMDYDVQCLKKVHELINGPETTKPKFIWVNLIGCEVIPKVSVGKVKIPKMNCVGLQATAADNKRISTLPLACNDDPRKKGSLSNGVEGCKAIVAFEDRMKDQEVDEEYSKIVTTQLYDIVSSYFSRINMFLKRLVDHDVFERVCVLSSHVIGLREHGVCENAPWESCSKSFIAITHQPELKENEDPLSIMYMHSLLNVDMFHRDKRTFHVGLTLAYSPSSLVMVDDKFGSKIFFIRSVFALRSRNYSMHVWFSLQDSEALFKHDLTKHDRCSFFEKFHVLVFDLTTDANEMNNLVAGDFQNSELCGTLFGKLITSLCVFNFSNSSFVLSESDISICKTRLVPCHRSHLEKDNLTRTVSTQTTCHSLCDALEYHISVNIFKQVKPVLLDFEGSISLFIHLKDGHPLFIVNKYYTSEELLLFADNSFHVIDVCGVKIELGKDMDDNIVLNDSYKLLSRTSRKFKHIGGESVVFDIVPVPLRRELPPTGPVELSSSLSNRTRLSSTRIITTSIARKTSFERKNIKSLEQKRDRQHN